MLQGKTAWRKGAIKGDIKISGCLYNKISNKPYTKHQMKLFRFLMFCMASLFTSCNSWKVIHTGEFAGETYSVQQKEHKGFSTNHFEWRIKLGRYSPVYINAHTSDWGPPYSDDLFRERKLLYLEKESSPYSNIPLEYYNNHHRGTLLYVPCKENNDKNCIAYFDLFENKWPELKSLFGGMQPSGFPEIIGIVSGKSDEIEHRFYGLYEEKKIVLVIHNDGRIAIEEDKNAFAAGIASGYYPKVVMPGKKILLSKEPHGITRNDLLQLKNRQGETPDMYFNIEETTINQHHINLPPIYENALALYNDGKKAEALGWFRDVKEYATREHSYIIAMKALKYLAILYKENGDTASLKYQLNAAELIEQYHPEALDSVQRELEEIKAIAGGNL